MRIVIFVVLILLANSTFLVAQQLQKEIQGKVLSNTDDVSNVHIRNLSSGKGTITDEEGNFSINAKLLDTLLFSAVQFKRKTLIITSSVLQQTTIYVGLEEFTNELDEVVLRPYDLSGDIFEDIKKIDLGVIVTETTLKLPNAHVKPPTQNERKLYTARTWEFKGTSIKLDPIINYFSGRTKMLKRRVNRDSNYKELQELQNSIPDSLFVLGLQIPKDHIYNFLFFCETDTRFGKLATAEEAFGIWSFLSEKSKAYRKNNGLE